MDAFMGTLVGALIALLGGLVSSNVQKMDALDSKSGWRKKLFELASKDMMTLDDIFLLRATLRLSPHKQPFDMYSFKYMSNEITFFCEKLILDYQEEDRKDEKIYIESNFDREKVRIYARYLLKNHWEVYSSRLFFFNNDFKLKRENELAIETVKLIKEIDKMEVL